MPSKRKLESDSPIPSKCSRVEEVLTRGNNPLMQLNELGIKGLKWDIEQIINVFPQRFRGVCMFTEPYTGLYDMIPAGVRFVADASSKTNCRHEIAIQIMSRLSGKKISDMKSSITSQPKSKEVIPNTLNKDVEMIPIDDAVRLLNEKVPNIDYQYNADDGGFCCYVSFRGFMIKGHGPNKKVAKRNVAMQILKKHFKGVFSEEDIVTVPSVDSTTTNDIEKLPLNRRKRFSSQIQLLVKNEYEKLVSTMDIQYSKRKVLAGIVISRRLQVVFPNYYREQDESVTPAAIDPMVFFLKTGWTINPDDCGEILKLITVTTGTKCLSGNEINPMGDAINDCHAEVVAKRALQYFLHKTIHRLLNNVVLDPDDNMYGTDIMELSDPNNQWTYKVKEDVKFHLYVSSSPCGDSRIFNPQATVYDESDDEVDEDSHPNRKNRGVLRTKIECGEGTIPIKGRHVQTWDGILGGERLRTMSCSDKVCVWNVLGLQGALLSIMLSQPVYLDTITVGSLFQLDHSQRALYERAKGVTGESGWLLDASNGGKDINGDEDDGVLEIVDQKQDMFQVNMPHILTVPDQDERCPGKSSSFSGNWVLGEEGLEVVATAKGLRIDGAASRLSKRSLFRSFLSVCRWCKVVATSPGGVLRYDEMKGLSECPELCLGAHNYHRKKVALFRYFEQQGYGRWVGKPLEQDWISLKLQD